jgi:hypothetical protein
MGFGQLAGGFIDKKSISGEIQTQVLFKIKKNNQIV